VGVTLRPRKLLFVTTDLFIGGGAEAMLSRLVTTQPPLADDITIVSLLRGPSHAEELRAKGVTVIELDFGSAGGALAGLWRIVQLIAQIKPDIVQGWMYHGDLAALFALVLSGRRRRTRLIWSIRCSDMDLSRYGMRLRLVVRACVALSSRPDLVTANSAAGMKFHLALGYRPQRSAIVPNGIDTVAFKPDPAARAAVRRGLAVPPGALVVAHVARADPMKDHATLLAALAQLPDLRALLIGPGTENLAEAPNVVRLGRRRDVARLLAASDIVVSSSAFGEGFSNALAEGMACGLPAVATDVGDAREILGDTGLIVPPRDPQALADALKSLAAEPAALRTARGERARARIVENFTLNRAAERFAALHASLGEPRGG
jgi:glycosyltransferase involved in cell wall biosynthesis